MKGLCDVFMIHIVYSFRSFYYQQHTENAVGLNATVSATFTFEQVLYCV